MPQASPIYSNPAYGEAAPPWLISEEEGYISREEVTLDAHAAELPTGLVLGKHTSNGQYAPHNPGGSDGLDAAAGILYAMQPAQGTASTATFTCTQSGGVVNAINRTGAGGHYVYGKSYTITPSGGTPDTPLVAHFVGQADGTAGPGIIDDGGTGYDSAPTLAADPPPAVPTTKATVVVRLAEVQYDLLEWDASCDTENERNQAMTDMAANHIIRR